MMKRKISKHLASFKSRVWIHSILILAAVFLVLVLELGSGFCSSLIWESYKLEHLGATRFITGAAFFLGYAALLLRLAFFLRGPYPDPIRRIPSLITLAAVGIMILMLGSAFAMEFFSILGWVNGGYMNGAMTMVPVMAVILAFTPVIIPPDMIRQYLQLIGTDLYEITGIRGVRPGDRGKIGNPDKGAQVLLVEHDILCATTVVNFCANVRLRCHHVSTIKAAEDYLKINLAAIKVVILENFVRTDPGGDNRTGAEWLTQLAVEHPIGERAFSVIMISGHKELLGEVATQAELVLQKPWRPFVLLDFFKEKKIVKSREGEAKYGIEKSWKQRVLGA